MAAVNGKRARKKSGTKGKARRDYKVSVNPTGHSKYAKKVRARLGITETN